MLLVVRRDLVLSRISKERERTPKNNQRKLDHGSKSENREQGYESGREPGATIRGEAIEVGAFTIPLHLSCCRIDCNAKGGETGQFLGRQPLFSISATRCAALFPSLPTQASISSRESLSITTADRPKLCARRTPSLRAKASAIKGVGAWNLKVLGVSSVYGIDLLIGRQHALILLSGCITPVLSLFV